MTRSAMLMTGGRPANSELATGGWTPAGELPSPRQWFSGGEAAVTLDDADGTVLAAGGAVLRDTATTEALLFSPKTLLTKASAWTPTGELNTARRVHTLTKLADGRVLAVGGMTGRLQLPFTYLNSSEIYDPKQGTWTPTVGSLNDGRALHSATLLDDGRVLVAGGIGYPRPGAMRNLRSAELFNPDTETWTRIGPMTDARSSHPAVKLPDGRVLLIGGDTGTDVYRGIGQAFCELFDPVTETWAPTGSLRVPRRNHQAVLLADGSVFVVGGNGPQLRTERTYVAFSQWRTEHYNPATGAWSAGGNAPNGRTYHRAVTLASGKVLLVGGTDSASYDVGYAGTVVYDPLAHTWSQAGGMATGRFYCSATALKDGRVLAAGGTVRASNANPGYGDDLLTATCEVFTP